MEVTREDLAESRDLILDEMRRGFDGVYERQDKTNGRVLTLEVEQGRQDERIKNIGKEVFNNRRASDRRHAPTAAGDSEARPITRRDVTIAILAVSGVVAFMKLLAWLGPALQQVRP